MGWKDWAIPHVVRTYKQASSATATCSAEGLEDISDASMCEAASFHGAHSLLYVIYTSPVVVIGTPSAVATAAIWSFRVQLRKKRAAVL